MSTPRPPEPPRWAEAFLAWLCPGDLLEEVQGDLFELFQKRSRRRGLLYARLRYVTDALRFFRPYLLRRRQRRPAHSYDHDRGPLMLKNYFKIALRNFIRHPGYAFINVSGLAVGVAVCLLIWLWVQDEQGFDRFHTKADRIVRVVEARESAEGEQQFAYTAGALGPALVEGFPEVEESVRMVSRWSSGRFTIEYGPARFYSGEHLFAEPAFFDVFDFELLHGDPATALNEPHRVVLTEEWAQVFYGDEDPMGQILSVERYGDFTVTGVVQNPPPNSHLDFSMLFSFATLEGIDGWNAWLSSWASNGVITYLVLNDGVDREAVQAKLPSFIAQHREDPPGEARQTSVQPLGDVHFESAGIEFEENRGESSRAYVYIFSAIALFIVLIACINYMNLATARSMRRAREVGLRKVVGAGRGQLVRQFLGEALLVTGVAVVLALGLVAALLPAFNALAGKAITINLLENGPFVLGLVGLVLGVGLAAGSYPALYLSRFRPAQVLKNTNASSSAAWLRRGLVVTQFALSIAMIVATLVVYRQMQYVQTKRLGFEEEQLVVVDINDGGVRRDFETVKREFANVPSVHQVSVSSNVPGDWKNISQIEMLPANAADNARITSHFLGVDADFIETFGMNLVTGRNFSEDFATDSTSVLLNEVAAARLGVGVGDEVRVPGEFLFGPFQEGHFQARIIGIVEDFHFESLHKPIGPMMLGYWSNPIDVIDYFTARIDGTDVPGTVAALQAIGERFDPSHPFEYNFLDERLADFYKTEQRVARLFGMAAMLAVFIACLGLFGLASYMAEQRTKEIGVRKVLGASVPGIIGLLSVDFLKLVALGFVLAAPVAYFGMQRWLNDFAYNAGVGLMPFLLTGGLVLAMALLTVSYQSIRAALTDPVKSLRYE